MGAAILDGGRAAERILAEAVAGAEQLTSRGRPPVLAAIRANDDPGTAWYAKAQERHCRRHGVGHRLLDLGKDAGTERVLEAIRAANRDPAVTAILLFTPLPPGISHGEMAAAIDPAKDAEGVHPANMGRLLLDGDADPAPCTARAAVELVLAARPDLSGARALVIGRSAIVGKPAGLMLLARHATVTTAHTRSDIRPALLDAEVVIAAAGASGARWRRYEAALADWRAGRGGKPETPDLTPLVTMDMVRRGAVVVDVGDNHVPEALGGDGEPVRGGDGRPAMKYAGDVDFDKVREVAGFITNPRGGVGPVTNAFLLLNVVRAGLRALS